MKTNSRPKAIRRTNLFGPPPIIEGENSRAYYDMLDRVSSAVGPTDFIEEIWVRDLVDVMWSMLRWRRILAALLSEEVGEKVNDEASSLAEAQTELMEGPEKEELDRLLDSNSELSWETRVAKYPRANDKFQELWSAARSTLNMDLIQARVLQENLDVIERIDNLIMIAQRRIDEVIRELDRHRIMRRDASNFEVVERKMIEGKTTNKKVA